jgi:Tfp pilus assembly protein PilV
MSRRIIASNLPWLVLILAVLMLGFAIGTTQNLAFAAPSQQQVKQIKNKQLPTVSVGPAAREAYTVYMSRDGIAKGQSAVHMTQLHQTMAAKGYVFASLMAHVENNDLKGWWITYLPAG